MQVRFLGNGIGFLIALLAVFNYIHMMAAGVQNRSGELAALESIGMTQAQLKQMLMLEGAGYAFWLKRLPWLSACLSVMRYFRG